MTPLPAPENERTTATDTATETRSVRKRDAGADDDAKGKLILGLMIGAAVLGLVLLAFWGWAQGRD